MKDIARKEAIRLRQEEGISSREITNKLCVSRSTVRRWLRGIILDSDKAHAIKVKGGDSIRQSALKTRIEFQNIGREKAKNPDPLYVAGIMLYWGEGTKSRCQLAFTNSEPQMHRIFLKFLNKFYPRCLRKITVSIHCYDDKHSKEDIEDYWLRELSLTKEHLRKTIINKVPKNSLSKRIGFLPYGVCKLRVSDFSILQEMYGALQEFCGEDIPSLSPEK